MPFTQANTILAITTPFGADAVLLTNFHAEERVSSLFRFDLEMIAADRALDFTKIVGKAVTVSIKIAGDKKRFWNGIVARFVQAGSSGKQTTYRAEVYPWLWFLTKTTDSRIFQEKSTPEIIEAVFGDLGFSDFKKELKGTYAKREYCVQYQETAFNFVSRLMEDEGIFYYFKHEDGKHTMVLADDSASNPPCPNVDKVKYTGSVGNAPEENVVLECTIEQRVIPGSYALSDYNFKTPETSLLAKSDGKDPKYKLFEYPGNHLEKSAGDAVAKLRIEAEEAVEKRISGTSRCRGFSAGFGFKLAEHERSDVNGDYILKGVVHTATGQEYENSFEAFPKATVYRPSRISHKPVIPGTQTAMVVGKSGEEIFTDEFGRVKVHFYWDRLGKKDDKSSCFIRVAQFWAGKSWGAWFLPRMGQEVVVSFLNGDPDRPLITGSVYNATQKVPYALPANQTKSTILGHSSKEGEGGNELRFEDKKDSEEIYFFAQKDMKLTVKNDWTIKVLHDQKATVKNDRTLKVEEGNEVYEITKGNRDFKVAKGNEAYAVKGTRDVKVDGAETHTNKDAYTQKVTKDYTLKVTGNLIIDVGGEVTFKSGKAMTIKSGMDMTIKSGMNVNAEAGMNWTAKAGVNMTNKAGVAMTNEGGVSLTNKAAATQTVDGGGMLTVKGGLVKIN
jgi:type VI secretion system secreted protein VgrG